VAARPAHAPPPVAARHAAPTLASARVEPARVAEIEVAEPLPEHLEQDLPIDVGATMGGAGAEADEAGGPPPPVVPTIRKGQKAQLRKKGAR
jgi:hypothetical protein